MKLKTILAGVLATGLCLIGAQSTNATELEGTTSIKVPKMKVLAIDDLGNTFKATIFQDIQNQPEKLRLMPKGEAAGVYRTYLVTYGKRIVLVDTGWGKAGDKKGQTLDVLAKKGIKPEEVTDILMTHLDGDHINGLRGNNGPVFPKATVHISKDEYEGWLVRGDARAKKNIELCQKVLTPYGDRIKTFAFDEEVLPNIVARDASGHTVGHTLYELGGKKGLVIVGDLFHVEPLQLRFTDYNSRFDMDKEKAAAKREFWLNHLSASKQTIAGMHFKSIGKVKMHPEGGYAISTVSKK